MTKNQTTGPLETAVRLLARREYAEKELRQKLLRQNFDPDSISTVMATLKEGGYPGDTPVAIVARATWPDQRIFRGTIDTIADILHQAGVVRQAMIVVGKVLDTDYELSKLYDSKFTTMFRKGTDGE